MKRYLLLGTFVYLFSIQSLADTIVTKNADLITAFIKGEDAARLYGMMDEKSDKKFKALDKSLNIICKKHMAISIPEALFGCIVEMPINTSGNSNWIVESDGAVNMVYMQDQGVAKALFDLLKPLDALKPCAFETLDGRVKITCESTGLSYGCAVAIRHS